MPYHVNASFPIWYVSGTRPYTISCSGRVKLGRRTITHHYYAYWLTMPNYASRCRQVAGHRALNAAIVSQQLGFHWPP
jgi:hypothetical protein